MARLRSLPLLTLALVSALPAGAQQQFPPSDIPATFTPPIDARDYVKREVMIPMRDGVKLHTVIVYPKGVTNAPIVLTRTPYDASGRANRIESGLEPMKQKKGDAVCRRCPEFRRAGAKGGAPVRHAVP